MPKDKKDLLSLTKDELDKVRKNTDGFNALVANLEKDLSTREDVFVSSMRNYRKNRRNGQTGAKRPKMIAHRLDKSFGANL